MQAGIPTLLVIDDEPGIREIIRLVAEQQGFTVFEAADGPTGIQLANGMLPSLIFCDLRMPRLKGRETLLALKQNAKTAGIPVMMISGSNDESEFEWRERGALGVLAKPFIFRELAVLLRKHSSRHVVAAC